MQRFHVGECLTVENDDESYLDPDYQTLKELQDVWQWLYLPIMELICGSHRTHGLLLQAMNSTDVAYVPVEQMEKLLRANK